MSSLNSIRNKVVSSEEFASRVRQWQQQGETVVFTNGVFDLLHKGHMHYLAEAADLGSKLVIGLNSDTSSRTLGKGPTRPIKDQETRAFLLASLFFVDAVCFFDEHTPLNLITQTMPDILVKGGDYDPDQIVGAKEVKANGGKVITLAFLPGHSTTAIEKKIRGEN